MFILILIFNLIALVFTAVAASFRPSFSNRVTVLVAICGFILALYQVDSSHFTLFMLATTSLLNLLLVAWLVTLVRIRKEPK